ncbi:MAG: transposase [Dehalococcoidia bacterium]|nr:transposase [Dehalococcoidia bacterium]
MEAREEKGLQIAALSRINKTDKGYLVPSQTGKGLYLVNVGNEPACSCPDFEARHLPCKHIFAVEFTIRREERPDGTTIVTKTMRVTYGQNWPAYNMAQTHEQERFAELLRDLCEGISTPPQERRGRPSHPLSAVVFGAACKVYSTVSGRRAMTDLRELQAKGYMVKAPSYNSLFDYLENPALTPLLKSLIEESASPLRAVETDFAVDSTGFATTTYDRWFDHKWGKVRSEAKWVKAHLMCGVTTNIVTSVEVTPTETADAPQFAGLVQTTAHTFPIREVSADKAYSSRRNLQVVNALGGIAYIPFKNRTTGLGHSFDGLWSRMWHCYNFNRNDFLAHYHKRSNIESTNFMIKAKFGGSVRSKTPTAQVNEVLLKVLCHNICVLISSVYELGLEPTFWNNRAEPVVARQMAPMG